MDREFGTDMFMLLYFKWITNKDLLYSTWNSAQCYVAAWMGGQFGVEGVKVCVWLSLGGSRETITLSVNWLHPNEKLKVKKKKNQLEPTGSKMEGKKI